MVGVAALAVRSRQHGVGSSLSSSRRYRLQCSWGSLPCLRRRRCSAGNGCRIFIRRCSDRRKTICRISGTHGMRVSSELDFLLHRLDTVSRGTPYAIIRSPIQKSLQSLSSRRSSAEPIDVSDLAAEPQPTDFFPPGWHWRLLSGAVSHREYGRRTAGGLYSPSIHRTWSMSMHRVMFVDRVHSILRSVLSSDRREEPCCLLTIVLYALNALSCWYYFFYEPYFIAFHTVYLAVRDRAAAGWRLLASRSRASQASSQCCRRSWSRWCGARMGGASVYAWRRQRLRRRRLRLSSVSAVSSSRALGP